MSIITEKFTIKSKSHKPRYNVPIYIQKITPPKSILGIRSESRSFANSRCRKDFMRPDLAGEKFQQRFEALRRWIGGDLRHRREGGDCLDCVGGWFFFCFMIWIRVDGGLVFGTLLVELRGGAEKLDTIGRDDVDFEGVGDLRAWFHKKKLRWEQLREKKRVKEGKKR